MPLVVRKWLIKHEYLERNAGVVCFDIATQILCPFKEWYGAYHPSPLGAPKAAKVTSAFLALTALRRHAATTRGCCCAPLRDPVC